MTAVLSFAQRVMIWKNAAVSTRTPTKASSSSSPSQVSRLDRFFHITERGSSISREIRGGIVTFFSMSYILVLNPAILSKASPPGTEAQLAAGTAFVAAVMTILMGVVANYPMALAAGLGINAMVAYTLVGTQGMTYADAMGLIVIEGIIILVLVLTGFREAVFKAVPDQLKTAISVGIGLFIALIGLVDAKMVRRGGTPLELGLGEFADLHPNVVAFEERLPNSEGSGAISMADLVRRSLRMNPSRVIVGEVLGDEIVTMLNAMSQGNDGSLSTIHANSSSEVFNRIATYAIQSAEHLPQDATNLLIAGAVEIGIKELSVYAFSTENWRRSPGEVRFIMGFARKVLRVQRDVLNSWNVRLRWIGRTPRLWKSVLHELREAERVTAHNTGLVLNLCINYGGRAGGRSPGACRWPPSRTPTTSASWPAATPAAC